MRILKSISVAVLLVWTVAAKAGGVESAVSEVVLYPSKALETRELTVNIKEPGRHEIVLTKISRQIETASLQAYVNGATLISASTNLNYLSAPVSSAMVQKWQDSLETTESAYAWNRAQTEVLQGEIALLNANYKVGGEQTVAYSKAVEDMALMYRTRLLKIREQLLVLGKEEKELNKRIGNLKQQIATSGAKQAPVEEIVLVVNAAKAGDIKIRCKYLVGGASWKPVYNLRSAGLQQPVVVEMLAEIQQNTGYDWNNVKLMFSTSNPSSNQSRPILTPEYVDYMQLYDKNIGRGDGAELRKNMAYAIQMDSDHDGIQDKIDDEKNYRPEITETSVAQLYIYKSPQDIKNGVYSAILPVNTQEMKSDFIYHIVPKKELAAFLIAKVPDWSQYGLLAANASIFFEENFVGQTYINPKIASDTLLLSMGRDELIQVERNAVKDVSSTRWIGSTKKEVKTFDIKIKNNKKTEVTVEILDQIPVSKQKDIEVVLESADGAEHLVEIGRLKWTLKLKPGESKTLRFSYSIKYSGNLPIMFTN